MARFAKGSRALAISYRSGAAFPYREMVKEWTGAWVHISEFEPKQPQLEPKPMNGDAIYSQAQEEIQQLEEQIQLSFETPIDYMVG